MLTVRLTPRGFKRADFLDASDEPCSIEDANGKQGPILLLGCNEGVHYDGHCYARMVLSRERVAELLPLMLTFVDTGSLPGPPEPEPTW